MNILTFSIMSPKLPSSIGELKRNQTREWYCLLVRRRAPPDQPSRVATTKILITENIKHASLNRYAW